MEKKAQFLPIPNGFTFFQKFISEFLRFAEMQVHSVKAYKKEQEIGLQKGTGNYNPFPNKYRFFETYETRYNENIFVFQ